MSSKIYQVEVFDNGYIYWTLNGKLHREDGPAIERDDGYKFWYLNDIRLTEEEFNSRMNQCSGKIIEIDGIKYKLVKA